MHALSERPIVHAFKNTLALTRGNLFNASRRPATPVAPTEPRQTLWARSEEERGKALVPVAG